MKDLLIVDDHQTFLAGTAMILEKHGYRATTASSGQVALELMREASFDMFIFDLKLPEMNGFELTEETLRRNPEAVIVILTGEDIAEHYNRLIEIGVAGILEKSRGEQAVIGRLRMAFQRLTVLPLPLARQLRTAEGRFPSPYPEQSSANKALTDKEIGVLRMIAQGYKNKDIADRLFMSQRNVEYVISHLFVKLNAASRQEAVLKGLEQKWINLDLSDS